MSNSLPAGWVTARLGEIADVQLGKMLDAKRTEGTSLPYLRNVNVRWGRIDVSDLLEMPFKDHELERYAVRSGDVMICEGGEPGRAAVWTRDEQDIKYQKALHRVRLGGGLQPNWLVYHLQLDASSGRLSKQFTGTTIGHLPREVIVEYELCLAPLPEQHRVVEAIESDFTRLDGAVTTLERVRRNLKRYRASVLQAAVEGRLVPTEAELARAEGRDYEPGSALLGRILAERGRSWREAGRGKYQEPRTPDTRDLPELPEGWCWTSVDGLLKEPLRNGHSARKAVDGDVRTLTLTAVTERDFSECNTKLTTADRQQVQDLWLEPGDIFVERSNTAELVGTAALYKGRRGFAIFPDLLIRVRPADNVLPLYVEAALRSPRARTFFRQAAQGIAGSMPKISQETVTALPVPLPPAAEQARIVAELERQLSVADEAEASVKVTVTRCARLRQCILKWAFEGRLADQDPTEEPASVMLARIKAEREAAGAAKTNGRPGRRTKTTA